MRNYKKYVLAGGVICFGLFGLFLTWFYPLYAVVMVLGALGTVVYTEWLGEKDKIPQVSDESDWTGI